MTKRSILLTGFALSVLHCLTAQAADRHTLTTHVPETAARLPMLDRLPATKRLELAIGLPFRNHDSLTNLVGQMYNRHSTNFHRYLTPEQFAAQFAPTEEDYQNVIDFAKANRLVVLRTFGNRAVVDVEGQVSDIERMFQIHLGLYQHPAENRKFYAPDAPPSVDAGLDIMNVSGLDNYVTPHHYGHATRIDKAQLRKPIDGSVVEGGSFPWNGGIGSLYGGSDFRHAYAPGIPSSLTGAGQVVGLFEYDGYTPGDIYTYETNADLPIVTLDNVLESYSPGQGNDEVASDIELVIAMAPGITQVNVYEGNNADTIINEMASPSKGEPLPNQISSSWGITGDSTIEQDLIEIAAQGQAYFAASGDGGAFVGPDTSAAQYYSSYMTLVGGTQLFMNGAGKSWSNEVVWHDNPGTNFAYFSSTGGVFADAGIPIYQKGVSMAVNGGSAQYRNFPDVAMVARDILIVATDVPTNGDRDMPGQFYSWVGTSAASPLWAGFTALVNQQAADQGLPPVGFLNPALYEIGVGQLYTTRFHDITNGNNTWFDSANDTGSPNLYYAEPGYDLCTGWGSPTGPNLINALLGYAGDVFVDFGYTGSVQNGSYFQPYSTLPAGISAVYSGGTIVIKNGGSSPSAVSITKPMTITAIGGAATIGH